MLSLLFTTWFLFLHPLHVSVTEIEYNPKAQALQIITRIFVDDLETAIRNSTKNPELDLLKPKEGITTQGLVNAYLTDHLAILLDGKSQKINFLGYEYEDLALVCYLEVENVTGFKNIEIKNTVITETYDDQSNLVHITYNGPVKSMRLTRDKPLGIFNYN